MTKSNYLKKIQTFIGKLVSGCILGVSATVIWVSFVELTLSALRPMWNSKPSSLVSPGGPGCKSGPAERFVFSGYHPILGYTGLPNVRLKWLNESMWQNNRGERGPLYPLQKPDGVRRIILSGDSQAWGYGVAEQDSIRSQLENILNKKAPEHRWQVVNLGVSGYGTDQEFLKFLLEAPKYDPDGSVFVVFSNDPEENRSTTYWCVNKPVFVEYKGKRCLANIPVPRVPGWPGEDVYSAISQNFPILNLSLRFGAVEFTLADLELVKFLKTRELIYRRTKTFDSELYQISKFLDCVIPGTIPKEARLYNGEEITVDLLTHAKQFNSGKLTFTVLAVPDIGAYTTQLLPESYSGIISRLKKRGVSVIDLLPELLKAGQLVNSAPDPANWFLNNGKDPHLNAAASRLSAQLIADSIISQSSVRFPMDRR